MCKLTQIESIDHFDHVYFLLGEVESKMRKENTEVGSHWRCLECDYVTIKKHTCFEHVEAKHFLSVYACHLCGSHCPSRNALRSHVNNKHKQL